MGTDNTGDHLCHPWNPWLRSGYVQRLVRALRPQTWRLEYFPFSRTQSVGRLLAGALEHPSASKLAAYPPINFLAVLCASNKAKYSDGSRILPEQQPQ
jgi:hypothetical protein